MLPQKTVHCGKLTPAMSQKQTSRRPWAMSAIAPIADIARRPWYVRFVPLAAQRRVTCRASLGSDGEIDRDRWNRRTRVALPQARVQQVQPLAGEQQPEEAPR